MGNELSMQSQEYKDWLTALKVRVRQIQLKAAVAVNQELLKFYWELGADIVEKQKNAAWGDGFFKQLSKDLRVEFPKMKGFSFSNIKYIRQWYLFYSDVGLIGQQAVGQLTKQPASQITKIRSPGAIIWRLSPNAKASMKHFIMCKTLSPTAGAAALRGCRT